MCSCVEGYRHDSWQDQQHYTNNSISAHIETCLSNGACYSASKRCIPSGVHYHTPLARARICAPWQVSLMTAQMTRQVDPDEKVLLTCAEHYFGEPDCPFFCAHGQVAGKMCLCADSDSQRQFGHDCSQTAAVNWTIPETWLQADSELTLRLLDADGAGLIAPPFALATGATIRIEQYHIAVTVSDQQPGPAIKAVGGVVVLLPHGLKFREEASLIMSYDSSKVGPDEAVFIYYLNQTSNVWQQMQGKKVADGLVVTKTNHFSTFAPMATAAPAGYSVEIASIPPPTPWLPVGPPPPPNASAFPSAQPRVSGDRVAMLVILMLGLALVVSLFILLIQRAQTTRRQKSAASKDSSDASKADAHAPGDNAARADAVQSPTLPNPSSKRDVVISEFVFTTVEVRDFVVHKRSSERAVAPAHCHAIHAFACLTTCMREDSCAELTLDSTHQPRWKAP